MKQYFSFQWHITDECDQRCKHCYIFSENCNKSWMQCPGSKCRTPFITAWTLCVL